MTKYILHGGNTSDKNLHNSSFFAEIGNSAPKGGTILLNYFSRNDDWNKLAEGDKEKILNNSSNKNLKFEISRSANLAKQIKKADVMYMRGGTTKSLTKEMKKVSNLKQLFKDKTIAGSSAGVYTLSKYYYSNDLKRICNGLGILNIKTYCHIQKTDSRVVGTLNKHKEELPLILLPNCMWISIYDV